MRVCGMRCTVHKNKARDVHSGIAVYEKRNYQRVMNRRHDPDHDLIKFKIFSGPQEIDVLIFR